MVAAANIAASATTYNYVSHSPSAAVRGAVARENARLAQQCGNNCTLADMRTIDLQMQRVEAAANLVQISKNSQLTSAQAIQLGENIAGLLPLYGTPIALYQAITGESLSGNDLSTAERFINGVAAAIPLGSTAAKLFNCAVADMRIAASVGGVGTDGKALMDFSLLSKEQKGIVGELIGAETVQNALPNATRLARMGSVGSQGIDDLYKVASQTVDYVVVEYKFGQSPLRMTGDGLQMSDAWVMGSDRILNAVGKNLIEAERVANAMKSGRVEKWVVHTDPAGGTSIWIVDASGKIAKADSAIVSRVIGGEK